jgi:hypothetical protein
MTVQNHKLINFMPVEDIGNIVQNSKLGARIKINIQPDIKLAGIYPEWNSG